MGTSDIKVKIKKVRPNAKIPLYATKGAAAADLFCAADGEIIIKSGECEKIPTGISISMELKESTERCGAAALIYARSGLSTKHGIAPANCVGVIDSDYRGEILVPLRNSSEKDFSVFPGDRIAQVIFTPIFHGEFEETDALDDTERRDGGFGSTGSC